MFGRIVAIVVLGVLVLAGYTGYQAVQVKDGLQTVASEVDPAVHDLQSGDVGAVRGRLRAVRDGAAQAADNSHGPGWWIATRIPGVGYDVQTIATVSDVSDQVASGVLPQVLGATTAVEKVNPTDGPQALHVLEHAGKTLARADKRLRRQEARVAAIRTDQLDPRLAGPVKQVQIALGAATDFLDGKLGQVRQALAALPSVP